VAGSVTAVENGDPVDAPHQSHDDADEAHGVAHGDALLAVRAELDEVEQLPIEDRAEVFERTHRIVVDELHALELG